MSPSQGYNEDGAWPSTVCFTCSVTASRHMTSPLAAGEFHHVPVHGGADEEHGGNEAIHKIHDGPEDVYKGVPATDMCQLTS